MSATTTSWPSAISFGARWRPTKPSPPKMTCLIERSRSDERVDGDAAATSSVVAAPALGDQHGADADEGDAGDAPGVEVLAEDEIGEHRDRDIGEAEERIGEGQLDLGQHVEVRRHRDDEHAAARANTHGLNTICSTLRSGLTPAKRERAERHHAVLQHQLRGSVGHHREEDEGQVFHVWPHRWLVLVQIRKETVKRIIQS